MLAVATSLPEAVAALAALGPGGAPLAGATWIMRAGIRGEAPPTALVALGRIDALRGVEISDASISIGACVTHAELAAAIAHLPDCRSLARAASESANPAIREMATVGGNLCASDFAAADLVPALLCHGAEVVLASPAGPERLTLADFLSQRARLPPGVLVHRVIVPRAARRSAHIRLPLRKAGDYPVAIVSMAVTMDGDLIRTARVAVGSVEKAARRWDRLESRLIGESLDPQAAAAHAEALRDDFHGRDSIEVPGWYRRQVLPAMVKRAVQAMRCS